MRNSARHVRVFQKFDVVAEIIHTLGRQLRASKNMPLVLRDKNDENLRMASVSVVTYVRGMWLFDSLKHETRLVHDRNLRVVSVSVVALCTWLVWFIWCGQIWDMTQLRRKSAIGVVECREVRARDLFIWLTHSRCLRVAPVCVVALCMWWVRFMWCTRMCDLAHSRWRSTGGVCECRGARARDLFIWLTQMWDITHSQREFAGGIGKGRGAVYVVGSYDVF